MKMKYIASFFVGLGSFGQGLATVEMLEEGILTLPSRLFVVVCLVIGMVNHLVLLQYVQTQTRSKKIGSHEN